jgi:hypothetical protein
MDPPNAQKPRISILINHTQIHKGAPSGWGWRCLCEQVDNLVDGDADCLGKQRRISPGPVAASSVPRRKAQGLDEDPAK